jgi:hypothetical protein
LNDVFLPCAADDAAWARTLTERLVGHGLSPFLVEWTEPGEVTLLRSEAELAASRHGIAVISPASLRDARAMDEYPDWYDRWSSTVPAVLHARLREGEARS